jgi:hypothetical protein
VSTQRDVEQLLRRIPLSTPAEESHASDMLQTFVSLRNAAFEGGGFTIPGTTTALSIPALIQQLHEGNYPDVAVTLIGVAGDAASAFGLLVTAGTEMGAIAGTGALASSGVVAGMIGDAAGPAAIAASVLVATFRIPSDVNENNKKLYFITDASGILASWIFNLPHINPHARLTARARRGGYFRVDVSDACRLAHQRVQGVWRSTYQGNAGAVRTAQASAGNSWERYWRQVGSALEHRLVPLPHRVGAMWVDGEIEDAHRRMRQAASDASDRRLAARLRREAGGYWFRTPEGIDLFMPDS